MIIIREKTSVIRDFGIEPKSILNVGRHAFVGASKDVAYAWCGSLVASFRVGDKASVSSLDAHQLANYKGLNYAGRNSEGQDVFMSASSACLCCVPDVGTNETYVQDMDVAMDLATKEALSFETLFGNIFDGAFPTNDLDEIQEHRTSGPISSYSTSRGPKPKYIYTGKRVSISDCHPEYDLELTPNDKFTLVLVDKDVYELVDLSSPRIKFTLTGHLRAFSLLANCEPLNFRMGGVANDKTKTFNPVGIVSKRIVKPFPLRVGAVIYEYRKRMYLADNLAVPLDKVIPKATVAQLITRLSSDDTLTSYVNGKLLRASAKATVRNEPEEYVVKTKKGTKSKVELVPESDDVPVYGAFFPVSQHRSGRSRLLFSTNRADLEQQVRGLIDSKRTAVDYHIFTTKSNDLLYLDQKASPNAVMNRATKTLESAYPSATLVRHASNAAASSSPNYVEPITGAPAPTVPFTTNTYPDMYEALGRLLHQGYFNTGIRVAPSKNNTGLRFVAPVMDDATYDQVAGIARRINMYLSINEVPVQAVRIARGKQAAEIRIKIKPISADQETSINMLMENPPIMNSPQFTTIKPVMVSTCAIRKYNIHTGMCDCQEHHGDNYREGTFDTLFSNLKRVLL